MPRCPYFSAYLEIILLKIIKTTDKKLEIYSKFCHHDVYYSWIATLICDLLAMTIFHLVITRER
ncbi:hypothetical protein EIC27_05395 [Candidatus Aquarickettsia rohweri]|uniref:Uncharacterized protein n=1 Tax=Candidatus Aquarickettsia rohweri TaxID=2602574 RepID=A0A429XF41_9RICK|nr:hypothetical protein EIC27_05395 [Candidatus Aquarickettsia rohweri]